MARFGSLGTQYFDDNGDPLSGGSITFYETGTTTEATTYSDEALTTANANPVVLDAAGRQPNIFFSGQLKAVLKDSGGTLVETRDPVGCCAAGAAGGGLWTWDWPVRTANFTAEAGKGYIVESGASDITVTLPASPSQGDVVYLRHVQGGSADLMIDRNGNRLNTETWTSTQAFVDQVGGFESGTQFYAGLVFTGDADIGWAVFIGAVNAVDPIG